jgi:hypothetical protein
LVAALVSAAPALCVELKIDDHTKCALAAAAVDSGDRDKILEVGNYIRNVMEDLDEQHTNGGEPGIIAGKTDQAMVDMLAMTTVHCRNNPKSTLYNAAAFVYRGTRDLETMFGVAK